MLLQARPNLSAAARLRAPFFRPLGFTPTPFLSARTLIRSHLCFSLFDFDFALVQIYLSCIKTRLVSLNQSIQLFFLSSTRVKARVLPLSSLVFARSLSRSPRLLARCSLRRRRLTALASDLDFERLDLSVFSPCPTWNLSKVIVKEGKKILKQE
jgi:hypothetical protein